jgi:hypothetical protein
MAPEEEPWQAPMVVMAAMPMVVLAAMVEMPKLKH